MVPVTRSKKVERVVVRESEVVQKKAPVIARAESRYDEPVIDKVPRQDSYIKKPGEAPKVGCALWFTVILCVGVLSLVIGGVIAQASLVIHPKHYSGTVDSSLTLSKTPGSGDLQFYTATQSFSDEQVIPSQTVVAHDSRATGTVRFYNNTSQAKTFPAKTVIKSSNAAGTMIAYQTKVAITVPPVKNKQPGQRDVVVVASEVGAQANIQKNDFVLGNPVLGIVVRSVTEMTGGAQGSDRVADPALVATARDTLGQSLTISDDMIARLKQELPQEMIVLPITFADSNPVITLESNHEDGVHVIAHKSVTIIMVKKTDLARIMGDRLNIPKGEMVTLPSLEGLSVASSALASPQNIPETISVRITGTAQLVGKVDEKAYPEVFKGLSKSEVRSRIANYPEIESVDIHMMPFWRRILPLDAEKISVTVTNP